MLAKGKDKAAHETGTNGEKVKWEEVKPYQCKHCSSLFKTKGDLTKHEKQHNTKGTFKCHICSKQLKQGNSYRKHMVNSHGIGEKCKLCDKLCLDKEGLELHMIKFHGD